MVSQRSRSVLDDRAGSRCGGGTDQLTEDLRTQLRALDGLRDEDNDLSDIPEQGHRTDWVRGLMYRPVTRAVSIRLPEPDIAMAQELAGRKGLPYQTYIKQLLHDALVRERSG